MKFSTKELIELYNAIYRDEERTDLEIQEFEVMISLCNCLSDTISWTDLSKFTPYIKKWFPILGYITEEILLNHNDIGNFSNEEEIIVLSKEEISFYKTLAKKHDANVKIFE